MAKNRNSIFYNFPVQFPCGPKHCGLNGAIFALSPIIGGIIGGVALIVLFGAPR